MGKTRRCGVWERQYDGPLSSPVSREVKVRHSCPGCGGRGGPMGLFSREAAPVSKHRKAAGRGAASARREEQG